MASGGKSVVFTAIAALGVFAGPGPGAAEAHGREAPRVGADLAVQSVTVTPKRSPQYFLIDDPGGIQPVFGVRVKNVGEAPTRADGRFRITLVLDDEVALPIVVKDFRVPRLRPGRLHTAFIEIDLIFDNLGLGYFLNRACVASRKDRHRRNNCRSGKPFSVIPHRWNGTADMTTVWDAEAKETAHADVSFTFSQASRGVFTYVPTPGLGSVEYSMAGLDSVGCSWVGSGEFPIHPATRFRLGADTSWYGVAALVAGGYPISVTCPGEQPFPFTGPISPFWIDTLPRHAKERNATDLDDTRTAQDITYTWRFDSSWRP
jgi:hypothetical protein